GRRDAVGTGYGGGHRQAHSRAARAAGGDCAIAGGEGGTLPFLGRQTAPPSADAPPERDGSAGGPGAGGAGGVGRGGDGAAASDAQASKGQALGAREASLDVLELVHQRDGQRIADTRGGRGGGSTDPVSTGCRRRHRQGHSGAARGSRGQGAVGRG